MSVVSAGVCIGSGSGKRSGDKAFDPGSLEGVEVKRPGPSGLEAVIRATSSSAESADEE